MRSEARCCASDDDAPALDTTTALVEDTTWGTQEVLLFDALSVELDTEDDATAADEACSREVMVNGEVQAVLFDSVAATLPDAGSVLVVVPPNPLRGGDRDGRTSGLSSSSPDVAMTIFFSRVLIRPIDVKKACGGGSDIERVRSSYRGVVW